MIEAEWLTGADALVTVAGCLDHAAVGELDACLHELAEHGARRLGVDLTGAEPVDEGIAGVLVRASARARGAGGSLAVVAEPPTRRALEEMGLGGTLTVVRDADALRAALLA